jgi:hypothetical protein
MELSEAPHTTGQDPRCADRPFDQYPEVDVAIVAESTYPYLKGGVSAVIHDIIIGNPGLTFGIIHIAWDSTSSKRDLYGMAPNVKWVRHVYLSMEEHREDFMLVSPKSLKMGAAERYRLAHKVFNALSATTRGEYEPLWELYDTGINPRTRTFSIWPILGTKEFMSVTIERLGGLGLPMTDTFWLLREFFSLAYALLSIEVPKARVYHAHTTGYASLLGAVGARQHGMKFLLTEHNLYVRDTVNTLLDRSLALPLTDRDWREFDVPPDQRAWMAWWTEMAHFCYPSAEVITYLYPAAISEAADLGSPIEKSTIVPNGMQVGKFDDVYQQRQQALVEIMEPASNRRWNLAYIARVVPIKGLADLISSIDLLLKRGVTNFHFEILGPTDHAPDYFTSCLDKARELGVEEYLTFRGTVAVRDVLGEFDLLVLPSYNEGQPVVVLEAMTAGIPVVGTDVGGMAQLITDPLVTPDGDTWGPCGRLVTPGDLVAMADALETVMNDPESYARYAHHARGRVTNFFQLGDVIRAYNQLYIELGGLPPDRHLDPVEANRRAIDLIYAEVGCLSTERQLEVVDANRRAIDLIYADLGGIEAEGQPEVVDANRRAIDLIYADLGGIEAEGQPEVVDVDSGAMEPLDEFSTVVFGKKETLVAD